jgi:hypothetical protein
MGAIIVSKRPVVFITHAVSPRKAVAKHGHYGAFKTEVEIARQLQMLLDTAYELKYVVTVETVPLAPLAMGNYRMIGNVRGER